MSVFGGDEVAAERSHGKIRTVFRDEVVFDSNFDSGNLDNAVEIPKSEFEYEFNLWTAPDCASTKFENSNRSWFYFSVRGGCVGGRMLLNIINMNIQMKLYQQGMTIVFKQRGGWERMKDRPSYEMGDWGMKLSFIHAVPSLPRLATYYAFCYPHSYTDCQRRLERIEKNLFKNEYQNIYYHRELLTQSLDGRRVDLITVSSANGITQECEPRLENLFPSEEPRARIFKRKKVYVLSARVHPGEVPGSHIFNGFLDFILHPEDLRAQKLRDKFVFKLVPMLNPDGVARGHYRTDSRGANLNRYYLEPDRTLQPSIFALRSVILHHHRRGVNSETQRERSAVHFKLETESEPGDQSPMAAQEGSGIAVFVDLHAHAAKRGCFIYGNHFDDVTVQTENMLYPKLVSLNSPHFDFGYCVFSEKNMYWKDKRDGLSKEGSGRVGIYKATGIIRSYTLECNYNTGRLCNSIAPADPPGRATPPNAHHHNYPPKFTVQVLEEDHTMVLHGSLTSNLLPYENREEDLKLGKSLAISALDLYECNPWSRVKKSPYGNLYGVRMALSEQISNSRSSRELSSSSMSSGRQRRGESRNNLAARPGSGLMKEGDEVGQSLLNPNNTALPSRSNMNRNNGLHQSYIPTPSSVTRQTDTVRSTRRFLVGDISKSSLMISKSTLSSFSVPEEYVSPQKGNPTTYKQFAIRSVKDSESDHLIPEEARVANRGLVGRKERTPQSRGAPANSPSFHTLKNTLPDMVLSPPRANSLVMGLDLATLFPIDNCTPETPPGYLSASPVKSRTTPNGYRMRRGELILRDRKKYEENKISLKGIEGKEFVDKDFNSEEIRLVKSLPKSLQDRALKCLKEQKLSDQSSKNELLESRIKSSTGPLNGKIETKSNVLYSAWVVDVDFDKKKNPKVKSKPRKHSVNNLSSVQPTATRSPRTSRAATTQRTKKKTNPNKGLPHL